MDKRKFTTLIPRSWEELPVFTGTRVPVDSLIIHLKAGDSSINSSTASQA